MKVISTITKKISASNMSAPTACLVMAILILGITVLILALWLSWSIFLGWLAFIVYREIRQDDWPWIHLWVWCLIVFISTFLFRFK